MGRKIILADQDGVIADFEREFLECWRRKYPNEFFVAPTNRRSFKLIDEYPKHLQAQVSAIYQVQGFFLNLSPIPGAIPALHEALALGYDLRICTAPLTANYWCASEKIEWIKRNLGRDFVKRVIITDDKTFVRGDYLIDDNPKITGACVPEWEHVIFDQPYNQEITDKPRVTWENWKQVLWL